MTVRRKFEVRTFTRSRDRPNSDWFGVLGGGCKAQSSGREGRRGYGMEPFEKALMSSYRQQLLLYLYQTYKHNRLTVIFCAI